MNKGSQNMYIFDYNIWMVIEKNTLEIEKLLGLNPISNERIYFVINKQ